MRKRGGRNIQINHFVENLITKFFGKTRNWKNNEFGKQSLFSFNNLLKSPRRGVDLRDFALV